MPSDGSGYNDLGINASVLNPNLAPLSPYMNFDPAYLQASQPEFIFPEGAARQRGRFELAFSQIGASCMIGGAIGGTTGLYRGLQDTAAAGQSGKLRRTQLLNYVMKQGARTANTLGVLAVMYSGTGVILSWARGSDDEINTIAAGTTAGLLYKASAGMKSCLRGGAMGFGLAALYSVWVSRDKLRNVTQYSPA